MKLIPSHSMWEYQDLYLPSDKFPKEDDTSHSPLVSLLSFHQYNIRLIQYLSLLPIDTSLPNGLFDHSISESVVLHSLESIHPLVSSKIQFFGNKHIYYSPSLASALVLYNLPSLLYIPHTDSHNIVSLPLRYSDLMILPYKQYHQYNTSKPSSIHLCV